MESIVRHTEGRIRTDSEDSAAFTVVLHYDTINPHAVDLEFPGTESDPNANVWTLAASLFYNDTANPHVVIGDQGATVTFDLSRDEVAVHLRSPEGEARIILPASEVLNFAKKVQDLLTPEAEEIARELLATKFSAFLAGQ
jgi:hypothetical protein